MTGPRLNRPFVLEARDRVADGAGGFTETWQALGTLWGALDARSGRDGGVPGGPVGRVAWRITLRAAPPGSDARPAAGQRLRLGARVFRVEAVAERGARGRYLTCYAEEEVAA